MTTHGVRRLVTTGQINFMKRLRNEGIEVNLIAQRLGLHPSTVTRFLHESKSRETQNLKVERSNIA